MTKDDLIGLMFLIFCILSVTVVIHGVSGSQEVAHKVIVGLQRGK